MDVFLFGKLSEFSLDIGGGVQVVFTYIVMEPKNDGFFIGISSSRGSGFRFHVSFRGCNFHRDGRRNDSI